MSSLLLSLFPLTAFITSLVFKRGAIFSSVVGIVSILLIVHLQQNSSYAIALNNIFIGDLPVILILTLSVALVIFSGQMMNSLLNKSGTIAEIRKFFELILISRLKLASIIILGVAPAIESLTGFGVSLFFTVPVLLHFFKPKIALLLSLFSVNIMPWGTLALSTLIGSQITNLPFTELSYQTSFTSFFVFPTIGALVYFVSRETSSLQLNQLLYPILTGLTLSLFLIFYNTYATVELAGFCSGVSVVIVCFLVEKFILNKIVLLEQKQSLKNTILLFSPYIILVTLIGLSKIDAIHHFLRNLYVLQIGDVKFSVMTSPGVFIFLTVAVLYFFANKYKEDRSFIIEGAKKSLYPITCIFMFISFAQIQRSSGILQALVSKGADFSLLENIFISPFVRMISDYITGSSTSGNVLFMPLQSEIGMSFNKKLLFAAIQNSSAGHSIFLSVPIILLAFSIAQMNRNKPLGIEASWLTRHMLLYAPFIYLALVVSFYFSIFIW